MGGHMMQSQLYTPLRLYSDVGFSCLVLDAGGKTAVHTCKRNELQPSELMPVPAVDVRFTKWSSHGGLIQSRLS